MFTECGMLEKWNILVWGVFSLESIMWWSTSWVHICFSNIRLVWRLPPLNTSKNTHMLLRPLGARGQQTWRCRGRCAPGDARGLIDLRDTRSVCGMPPPWLTNLRKQSTRKSFPSSFLQALTQLRVDRLWENFLFIELSLMIDVATHGLEHAWPAQAQKKRFYSVSPRFAMGFSHRIWLF